MDVRLTDGDIVFLNGALDTVTGGEAVGQHVQMRLATWLEESAYDTSAGVPYLQGILGRQPVDGIAFIIDQEIRKTPGVTDIKDFAINIDNVTRLATISGTVVVRDEEINFTVEVAP